MKIRVNATRVTGLLDNTIKALPQEVDMALQKTALAGIQIIQDRTAEGTGYFGKFAPYNPQYAKRKAEGWPRGKVTRAFGGDASGIVNLTVHGEMLSAMAQRKVSQGVREIYFTRATEARKAYYNNLKRKFFGFNQKEKRRLGQFFKKVLLT